MGSQIALAVLGGGQGRRIGRKKSRLVVGRHSLLEILAQRIGPLFSEKYYVSKASEENFVLPSGFKRLNDLYDYQTPLVGIYTALFYADSGRVLVVACDMPFVKPELVKLLVEKSLSGEVIIPCSSRGPEPLMAIYSKNCLQAIKKRLESGERKVITFFNSVRVCYLSTEEIKKVDPDEISFFNINTAEDLKKAQELIKVNV